MSAAPRGRAPKREVESHEFRKGQRVQLDSIYFIQGLAGGDWWDSGDPSDGFSGEDVTITRNIRITIVSETFK